MLYTTYKYSSIHISTAAELLVHMRYVQSSQEISVLRAEQMVREIQLCLLHLVQDGAGELLGGSIAAHVACSGDAVLSLAVIRFNTNGHELTCHQ